MAPYWTLLVAAMLCIVGPGCIRANEAVVSIKDPTQRIQFRTVSFLPPQSQGWNRYLPQDPHKALFVKTLKAGARPSASYIAVVHVKTIDDVSDSRRAKLLAATVQNLQTSLDLGTGRLAEFKSEREASSSADCVRFGATLEVIGDSEYPAMEFTVTLRGVACIHPHSPLLVRIEYSERVPKGEPIPSLIDKEGESFLKSIVFH